MINNKVKRNFRKKINKERAGKNHDPVCIKFRKMNKKNTFRSRALSINENPYAIKIPVL